MDNQSRDQQIKEALREIERAVHRVTVADRRTGQATPWTGPERRTALLDRRLDGVLQQIEEARRRIDILAGDRR